MADRARFVLCLTLAPVEAARVNRDLAKLDVVETKVEDAQFPGDFPGGFPGDFPGGGVPGGADFPGGGGFPGLPGSGGGGGFPGVPGQSMMADMLACGQKSAKMCCGSAAFMAEVCEPLQYCMIAVGTAEHVGPFICPPPPLPNIMGMGNGKCAKTESDLKDEMKLALADCKSQLQPLYNLQKDLSQCVHEADSKVKDLEQDKEKIGKVSKEGQECASKGEEAKSAAQIDKMNSFHSSLCPSSFFVAAIALWQVESMACMASKIAEITVTVPDINIKIDVPKIDVSIDVPVSEIKVPAFDAPDFDSNIVIPGGGPKINAGSASANTKLITLETRMAHVKADLQKCEDSKAKILVAEKQMQKSLSQATEQKTTMCKSSSLVQMAAGDESGTSPDAQAMIEVLKVFRVNPFFSCVSSVNALDALISDFSVC